MRIRSLALKLFYTAVLSCFLFTHTGCQPEQDLGLLLLDTNTANIEIDDLKRAMDFVRSKKQFEIEEFESKVTGSLNRWASTTVDEEVEWPGVDPMVKDLMEEFSQNKAVSGYKDVSYQNSDAAYLQGCAWSKLIADRVASENQLRRFELFRMAADFVPSNETEDDQLSVIMKKLNPELDDAAAVQLADAMRMFDWIVRNIQLVDVPEIESMEDAILNPNGKRPSEQGIRALGSVRFPSQVYVYGRADYAERAKVFLSMLTQAGMDACLLSVESKNDDGAPTSMPWCVAVCLNGEFYLFDTRLSMPIPNHKTKGLLTLSQLKKEPELLSWLDLTIDESLADDTKYWVRPEQVESIKGRMYVAPESVSKRMAKLQSGLPSDDVLVYFQPSETAERLRGAGLEEVDVWPIAFDTHLYRYTLKNTVNEASTNNRLRDKTAWYFTDEAYIDSFHVYRSARSYFIHGQFQEDEDDVGRTAIAFFFALMYTEDTIRDLGTNSRLQRRHGILKKNQSGKEYQETLRSVQAQMRLIGRDTSYFLAQCHFENGSMNVAAGWLDRIKDKSNADRWRDGIVYLLGRSLEANREYDRALEAYKSDQDSTQMHGNLIRARMLSSLIPKQARP